MVLLDDHSSIRATGPPAEVLLRAHLPEDVPIRWAAHRRPTRRRRWKALQTATGWLLLGLFFAVLWWRSSWVTDPQWYWGLLVTVGLLVFGFVATLIYHLRILSTPEEQTVYGLTDAHVVIIHPDRATPTFWNLRHNAPLQAFSRTDGTFDAYYIEIRPSANGPVPVQHPVIEDAPGGRETVALLLRAQRAAKAD